MMLMMRLWMGKIILALMFAGVYLSIAGWNKPFIVIFAAFYIIYMIWETVMFIRAE
jgi:hypothetical protein